MYCGYVLCVRMLSSSSAALAAFQVLRMLCSSLHSTAAMHVNLARADTAGRRTQAETNSEGLACMLAYSPPLQAKMSAR